MRRYCVIVWRNGVIDGVGEVLGHYLSLTAALDAAEAEMHAASDTIASVYELQ